MSLFANSEKSNRDAKPVDGTISVGASSGQGYDEHSILQRAIGNQGAQGLPQPAPNNPATNSGAPVHHQAGMGDAGDRTGMPRSLMAGLESLSGIDLSGIRVHRDSPKPAELDALAYAQGENIYLGPGEEKHLPHEGWHVVQQMQGRVKPTGMRVNDLPVNDDPELESEADRMGLMAAKESSPYQHQRPVARSWFGGHGSQPVQRQVRINGGASRVTEADYLPGGSKSSIGSRHSVASLIGDGVRRVFTGEAELEGYANGLTDYIGDVATSAAGTFWYRLPENQLTVLGEIHHNPRGNVEDVILGLRTSRFMYEPFNELASVSALNIPFTGTQSRLTQVNSGRGVGGLVDRTNFNPDLENIVIKALTGASVARNEFIPGNPPIMSAAEQQRWGRRASTSDYSFGERIALYLSMAIHIAADISSHNFGPPNMVESLFISSGRQLKESYLQNQAVLDQFMNTKDGDDLIGIYDLTAVNNFADLPVINDFTLVFHEYGSRYIEQLGTESGNAALQAQGQALAGNTAATLTTMSPAREEIMWEKIRHAMSSAYLIVGMGDAHRTNLAPRLAAAGIPHEEVEQSLTRQSTAVNTTWTP
jgi:hypothetical protein